MNLEVLILMLSAFYYIQSNTWIPFHEVLALKKRAYYDFYHDLIKLMHLLLKPLKIYQISKYLHHPFKLDFACKFAKRYCKLNVMYALKSLLVNCKNATAVNLLRFECQYCWKVKRTANWMFYIHWKNCMNVVQNSPAVNLMHLGYQYCGKVKDTANWIRYMHWKVWMNIKQNTSTVILQHFWYQYCRRVKIIAKWMLCLHWKVCNNIV